MQNNKKNPLIWVNLKGVCTVLLQQNGAKIKGLCQGVQTGAGFLFSQASHPYNQVPFLFSPSLKREDGLLLTAWRCQIKYRDGDRKEAWRKNKRQGGEIYQVGDGIAGLSDSNLENRFHLTQSAIITAGAELIKKLAFLIVVCSHRDEQLTNVVRRRCCRTGQCDKCICYCFY